MTYLGDDHYRKIADLRRRYGYSYAKKIAEIYGCRISAVHRWVNEARRRGFLEPHQHRCRCFCGSYLDLAAPEDPDAA